MESKGAKIDSSFLGNSALLSRNRIYNSGIRKKPAELFRKDLISAMKLPDSDQLNPEDYLTIQDPWKEEWEKGVQVPVNPDSLNAKAVIKLIPESERIKHPLTHSIDPESKDSSHTSACSQDHILSPTSPSQFKMPKKLLKFQPERDEICSRYEIDLTDLCWIESLSEADVTIGEDFFEDVMNELEVQCSTNMKAKHVGIEFDDHIVCDICRSPDAEDGNEMVFCDSCNICVHQACYGITVIPDDEWLCRPCRDGKKNVSCILCPNMGGAFKPTSNGQTWAHVACALWTPEVSIGNVSTMEPVTKIKSIPASRWALVCCICNVKNGAPIQCSFKTCKTAYHVTCAFNEKLKMKAIVDDESNGGVKLKSYCQRHSDEAKPLITESDEESRSSNVNGEGTTRATKTQEFEIACESTVESEKNNRFWMYIDINEINQMLVPRFHQKYKDLSNKTILFHIDIIQQYWKLKRTSNFGLPLIKVVTTDTIEEIQMAHRSDILKLRVNLERIRNLSYMITRREKLKRTWLQSHRDVVEKSLAYALSFYNPVDTFNNSPCITVKDEKKCSSTSPIAGSSSTIDIKKSPSKGSNNVTPVKSKGSPCPPNSPFIPEDTGLLVKNIISSSVIYDATDEAQVELDKNRVKNIMRELNRLTKINQLRRRVPNPYLKEYTSKCTNNINTASCSSDSSTSTTTASERNTNHCFRPSQESDEESSPKAKVTRGRNSCFENKNDLHHPVNGVLHSTRTSPVKIKNESATSPGKSNSSPKDQKNSSDQVQMLNQVNRNQVSGSKSPTNQNHLLMNGHESLRVLNDHHHNNSSPSSSPNCKKLTRSSLKGDFKKCNGLRSSDPHETDETNVIRKYF